MVIVDDEEEKDRKACGEAVLAVMEKTREKKKGTGGILAELSIRTDEPPPATYIVLGTIYVDDMFLYRKLYMTNHQVMSCYY